MRLQIEFRTMNVARFVTALGITFLLSSCTGGCKREESNPEGNTAGSSHGMASPQEDVEAIYSQPVVFEEQSLAEAEHLALSGRPLTTAETATVITTNEAALNHLCQILEGLIKNDDHADTWHVLTELDGKEWPVQTFRILGALDQMPLDGYERERVSAMFGTADRIEALIVQLQKTTKNLKPDNMLNAMEQLSQ